MKRFPLLGIVVIAGLCVGTAAARASVMTDDLGAFPSAWRTTGVFLSPDCHNIAMVAGIEKDVELRVNGRTQTTADAIPFVLYSPDSERTAYMAMKDYKWYLGVDGREVETGWRPTAQMVFSADGRHLIYVGASPTATGMKLVVDGVAVGQEFREIQDVVMTPKGDHVAFTAHDPSGWFVILDGKKVGATYPVGTERIALSQDGGRIAYVGVLSRDDAVASRYEVDIDGKPYGPYYEILSGPGFGPDSKVFYGADKATGPARLYRNRPVFPLAYPEVVDGKETYDPPGALNQKIWSSDGRHVMDSNRGYMPVPGNLEEKDEIRLDGKDLSAGPYNVTLSPDGLRVASAEEYSVPERSSSMRLDGHPGAAFAAVGPPLFSAGSDHLAYAVQDNKNGDWYVVLDQREDSTGALVCPTTDVASWGIWNPITKFEDQKSIDNGHSYNGQIPYHFDPDGTLVYFRIEGGHLYRVHWKPDDATTTPTTKP